MTDQERITDFLCSEKKMTANYDSFASECVNIPELFQTAQERGWYSPEQAQSDKIQQAYTKYSNQQPTGQQ